VADDAGRQWVRWGEDDPWYGVLSEDAFRNGKNRDTFLARGEARVAHTLDRCRDLGLSPGPEARALEFGCGVGRILAPLAVRFSRPVGIDIAPGMLAEAARLLPDGQADLRQATSADPLPLREEEVFDLIYSGLVLQHIPPRRGRDLLQGLLSRLSPGGVAVIQAPYRTDQTLRYTLNRIRASHHLLFDVSRLLMGRFTEVGRPVMQMNIYPPAVIAAVAESTGCQVNWVELAIDDFDYLHLATWFLTRPHAS